MRARREKIPRQAANWSYISRLWRESRGRLCKARYVTLAQIGPSGFVSRAQRASVQAGGRRMTFDPSAIIFGTWDGHALFALTPSVGPSTKPWERVAPCGILLISSA